MVCAAAVGYMLRMVGSSEHMRKATAVVVVVVVGSETDCTHYSHSIAESSVLNWMEQ